MKANLLLISGDDDKVWPSSRLSDEITNWLKKNSYSYYYKHYKYKGAGHLFMFPYRPIAYITKNMQYYYGGNTEANYHAHVDSWKRTVEFFGKYL